MKLSVAQIGHGSITTRHSYAFDRLFKFYNLPFTVDKKVVCGRDQYRLDDYANQYGWNEYSTDWESTVSRSDIDIVDICTPDYLHFEMAKKAIECGKHVICEKPLVSDPEEAKILVDMAGKAGVLTSTVFNIRYHPGIAALKHLIKTGALGNIIHIRASFIMDWALEPMRSSAWRTILESSPLGVLNDLGSHLVDLCRFLGEEFEEVSGFSRSHMKPGNSPRSDDTAVFTALFKSGAIGGFEASWVSGGRGTSGLVFEVHGKSGNAMYEILRPNELLLQITDKFGPNKTYERVKVSEVLGKISYPWSDKGEFDLPDAFTMLISDFISSIINKNSSGPTFTDGYECCRIVSAVAESGKNKSIINI